MITGKYIKFIVISIPDWSYDNYVRRRRKRPSFDQIGWSCLVWVKWIEIFLPEGHHRFFCCLQGTLAWIVSPVLISIWCHLVIISQTISTIFVTSSSQASHIDTLDRRHESSSWHIGSCSDVLSRNALHNRRLLLDVMSRKVTNGRVPV